jgi:hypothetical protein
MRQKRKAGSEGMRARRQLAMVKDHKLSYCLIRPTSELLRTVPSWVSADFKDKLLKFGQQCHGGCWEGVDYNFIQQVVILAKLSLLNLALKVAELLQVT